jgi:hypothetical protein
VLAHLRHAIRVADPSAGRLDRRHVVRTEGGDDLLHRCVGCHATYRQQVVDEATWQRLTAQPDR